MDKQALNVFNAAVAVLILAVAFFSWFYIPQQFFWGALLIILVLLIAGYVNVTRRMPWEGMSLLDLVIAIAAVAILGYAWFYLQAQFCWAGSLVVLLLAVAAGVKLAKWLRNVTSVQVIVHKKEENDETK